MFLLLLPSSLGHAPAPAQQQDAVIVFRFDRIGLPVPSFNFTVHENGTGTYAATYAAGGLGTSMSGNKAEGVPPSEQPLALPSATTARLFQQVRSTNHFHSGCASKAKNIADTGTKVLTYTGPDGTASCTYNYTENKTIVSLTDTFQGMAATLDAARRIEFDHRFDRLGLDREMNSLVEMVRDGRALELSNIASVLQSLVDDPQVLERVRTRAAKLLEQSSLSR